VEKVSYYRVGGNRWRKDGRKGQDGERTEGRVKMEKRRIQKKN
jgi:hypothetical protein